MGLYAAKPKVLDASKYENSLWIYGTGSKDIIYSGNSDNTAVVYTVDGGEGNDTMYGGDRRDVFYYDSDNGNDVIYDFTEDDRIHFNNSNAKLDNISYDGDDVILNLTSGNTITLKNAKGTTVNVTGQSSGSYSTSDESQLLAPELDEYWFERNEGAIDELDQIIETKDNAVDMPDVFAQNIFKHAIDNLTANPRHRNKK